MIRSFRRSMFLSLVLLSLIPATVLSTARAQLSPTEKGPIAGKLGTFTLHSGWKVTPAGDLHERTQDMLFGSAVSPDGKTVAFTASGFNDHLLYLVDTATGRIRQTVNIERTWNGVAWSSDSGTLYVSGGMLPQIHVLKRDAGKDTYTIAAPIKIAELVPNTTKNVPANTDLAYISGVALSKDDATIYAANFVSDTLYAISIADGKVIAKRKLDEGARPYCLRTAPDNALVVTEWGSSNVYSYDGKDLEKARKITPGSGNSHPNDLLFGKDGRLYIACGNDNIVTVVDWENNVVRERIRTTLTPRSPAGTTPNALALSSDEKTLYIANANNNNVAVVDVSVEGRSRVKGFIPTGWYPTAVAASPDGKRLFLGTGKGTGTRPSALTAAEKAAKTTRREYTYIPSMLHGLISTVSTPTEAELADYTKQVFANTPYSDAQIERSLVARPTGNPVPAKIGDASPIKHVLYIIKENRTYDQVLGDLKDKSGKPMGNGDPSITMFGESVTPNLHAIAREFVCLDNIYASGEVSGNGHPWSTGAYATDATERLWVHSYSSKATYAGTDRTALQPNGRIWDYCERAHINWLSYYYTWTTDNTRQNMPAPWAAALNRGARDTEYADLFINDLKKYEASGVMPNFMIMTLREDHTFGTSPGRPTPTACVASNDQGVGKLVEACSKSRFWKEMAIFVIEDDAQDGPDHVDAHRTTAYVVSPYTRIGKVDSTRYNTVSLLRTMELILGLPPMSQYDASATPMYNSFAAKPDMTVFNLRAPGTDLNAMNTALSYGAKESLTFDFTEVDQLTAKTADLLNRILWHSVKGAKVPYPGATVSALLAPSGKPAAKDDDD